MPTRDSSEAATPEARGLSLPWWRNWYIDRHGDRIYWVYTPTNYKVGTAVPLIMVLHGCMQPFNTHPWCIARDTHMNQLAETHQFLVVYPHHFAPPDINPISCWNFFLPENQHRNNGEPASLAGIVQDMLNNTSRWTIDPQRIYVTGISSGGGATANLGATYPDLFAAIAVHSGGEYGYPLPFLGKQAQARDTAKQLSEQEALSGEVEVFLSEQAQARDTAEPPSEREASSREVEGEKEVEKLAMIRPGPDPTKQGKKAFQAMGSFARVVPVIVFHGTADPVSDPINGDQVTQQWITTNHLASPSDFTATYEHPSNTVNHPAGPHGERPYTVSTWQDTQGRDVVIYYKVEGMGHAWSGGTPGSIFTDKKAPDASKTMYEFFMAHPKERKKIEYPLPVRPISVQPGRRALCVGINQFKNLPQGNWLNGCVNDAQDMASVLHDLFGFSENQITVLTDAQATKARVYSALQDMVEEAKNNEQLDYLVFSFSSHGTQVPDLNGDEPDWADEALCAHDIRAAGNQWDPSTILADDELHDLFTQLPQDVLLEAYFDTCHSGTGLKAADLLPGRRPKFLPPPTSSGLRDMDDRRLKSYREMTAKTLADEPDRHHTLFAACLDSQTASDALFAGRPNGAFTYFLVKEIRATRNQVSRKELLACVSTDLKNAGFAQTPQLETAATDRSADRSVAPATTKKLLASIVQRS